MQKEGKMEDPFANPGIDALKAWQQAHHLVVQIIQAQQALHLSEIPGGRGLDCIVNLPVSSSELTEKKEAQQATVMCASEKFQTPKMTGEDDVEAFPGGL